MSARAARSIDWIPGICGICPGGCGVEIKLVDGKLDRIRPLKGHPQGIVCARGAHSKNIVYSPLRLKYPQMRVGEKGEGKFKRITWDEAFDRIAEKLLKIKADVGPEAVMTYVGRGGFDNSLIDPFAPPGINSSSAKSLLFPFGSPNNAGANSICNTSYTVTAGIPTFGISLAATHPDFADAKLIVVWGANPATDSPPANFGKILQAKRRGARIIVIDHRRSEMARAAHEWIPIRPGTDGALALGMINAVIEQDLFDREFVERWVLGFDELREYVRRFTPEEVERITKVPRQAVLDTARAIATARHATLSMYTGLEYTNSGVQNLRAVFSLYAITGNLDVPGGIVFHRHAKSPYRRTNIAPPADVKPIGYDKFPLFCDLTKSAQFMETPRAILEGDPYPIKALIVDGASILTCYPDPGLWRRCLAALDLLVVADRFKTADAQYADFVLPATTYYENSSYQKHHGFIQLRRRVIEPLGEARSDYHIFVELARRLGYGDLYPPNEEASIEFVLRDHPVGLERLREHPEGISFGKPEEYRKYEQGMLRADGQPGFPTPSGKVEIASSLLAKYGHDALPVYVEPLEGPLADPALAERFPLVLNTGARIQSTFRSQHLNIPALVKMQPEPHVMIHCDDALARGIVEGERVHVVTPRGRVAFTAKVTDGVIPGSVEVNVGGGGPQQAQAWREANANYLTDPDNRDPISGFPVLKALLCEVEKIKAFPNQT
ncbi:MAG: molybdopterin-dependent oxidoreductase [Betaproteobacteria bacterium]|nr:molybdopterin-dependent oxidoreductase [Betaproteobacteria bacterium]